jgi:hypothetical protein
MAAGYFYGPDGKLSRASVVVLVSAALLAAGVEPVTAIRTAASVAGAGDLVAP